MEKLEMLNIKNVFLEHIKQEKEGKYYCIADKDYVYNSFRNDFNKDYCIEHNIPILDLGQEGGTIITSNGNVGLAIFKKDGFDVGEKIMQKIYDYLSKKIDNLSMSNNDLLVDGKYKVASWSSRDMTYKFILTTFQFSINVNEELIRNICLKPMNKIPKGLSDYGITTEEIESFIQEMVTDL